MRTVEIRGHDLDTPSGAQELGERRLGSHVEDSFRPSIQQICPRAEEEPGEAKPWVRQTDRADDVSNSARGRAVGEESPASALAHGTVSGAAEERHSHDRPEEIPRAMAKGSRAAGKSALILETMGGGVSLDGPGVNS